MKLSIVPAIHPGEILREEFLRPLGLSAGALAGKLRVPRTRIERIATEQAPITTNTALRLAKYFDTTPEFWLAMQTTYDIDQERKAIADELAAIESARAA